MKKPDFTNLSQGKNPNRKSFLIRFWRKNKNASWQVTLIAAEGESKTHFSDIESFKEGLDSFLNERN